ncbi:MarR family transcriptional regulator, partial [Rhodococcus chondri]
MPTTDPTRTAPDVETASAPEELRLALRAATLYYLDGLTQAEVANRLGVSRATAGRLVARARSQGLVRIEVAVPPDLRDDLHADTERALEQCFGLTEAVVVGVRVDDIGP